MGYSGPSRNGHDIAMTLMSCTLADFAKMHGYMDILPILYNADRLMTKAIHL